MRFWTIIDIPGNGTRCVVTLMVSLLYRNGKRYNCVVGPYTYVADDSQRRQELNRFIRMGTLRDINTHVTIPLHNVAGFVETNKVIEGNDVLVLD